MPALTVAASITAWHFGHRIELREKEAEKARSLLTKGLAP